MNTADSIEKIVYRLVELKKTHNEYQIDSLEEFSDFRNEFKMLYDMVVKEPTFEMNIFKEMMKMKRRLESGEEQYSVDVRFGEYMADRYIHPVIKN